jgi:alpha-1,6-mannosyltransferase
LTPGAHLAACAGLAAMAQAGMVLLAPALVDERAAAASAVGAFVALGLVAGLAWFAAIGPLGRLAPRAGAVAAVAGFGLLARLAWFGPEPVLDTDALRYLWDGGLAAQGVSPWGLPPAAQDAAGLGPAAEALRGRLYFAGLRTIYPVTAQAAFLVAHWLAPWELAGLRLVMLAAEMGTVALLVLALRRLGLPPMRAAIWWTCPLLPVVLVGGAHVDALLPVLLLGALLATLAGRGVVAGVLLGLAAGVKVWPVLLAPLFGRALPAEARLPAALALGAVAAATLAPLLATAVAPDAGLIAYARGWLAGNAPFAWAVALLGTGAEPALRAALAFAGAAIALAVAVKPPGDGGAMVARALVVAAAVFYLSPAQFPWYVVWFMPFATLLACRALLLPAALLPLYWLAVPLGAAGQGWVFSHLVAAVPLLAVLAALALGRRRA